MARLNFRADHFDPINKRFVLFEQVAFAYLPTKDPYNGNAFQVGGIADNVINQVQFAGLNESEVQTGTIIMAQLGLQWKFTKSIYLTGRVNIALYDFYQVKLNDFSAKNNFLSGYSLTAGLMTPIGPIEITAMYCDQDGRVRSNLNLGYGF